MCAKPRPAIARSVKTPEALAALRAWLATFPERTRERGAEYFAAGAVQSVGANADHFVEARVAGQDVYRLTLFFTRGKWTSRCSCPMIADCKHVHAAALAWIVAVESGTADRDELTPSPPPEAPPPTRPAAFPAMASLPPKPALSPASIKKKPSFREQWTPSITAKLGRPLTEAEGRQLENLATLFAEFSQSHRVLYPDALRRHGFSHLVPRDAQYHTALFPGWWDHATAPADRLVALAISRLRVAA